MSHKIRSKVRKGIYMNNFVDFLLDLLKQFFGHFWNIFSGIFKGLFGMFDVKKYVEIFKDYCGEFNGLAWFLAILVVIFLIAALVGIGFSIYFLIRKYIRIRRPKTPMFIMLVGAP